MLVLITKDRETEKESGFDFEAATVVFLFPHLFIQVLMFLHITGHLHIYSLM